MLKHRVRLLDWWRCCFKHVTHWSEGNSEKAPWPFLGIVFFKESCFGSLKQGIKIYFIIVAGNQKLVTFRSSFILVELFFVPLIFPQTLWWFLRLVRLMIILGFKYPLSAQYVIYLLSTSQYQEQSGHWEYGETPDTVKLVQDLLRLEYLAHILG